MIMILHMLGIVEQKRFWSFPRQAFCRPEPPSSPDVAENFPVSPHHYPLPSTHTLRHLRSPLPCPRVSVASHGPEASSKGFPILPTMDTIVHSPWTLSQQKKAQAGDQTWAEWKTEETGNGGRDGAAKIMTSIQGSSQKPTAL